MKQPQPFEFFRRAGICLMMSLLLAGCGQYGNLYLPEEPAAEATAQDGTLEQEEQEVTQPEDL